MIFKRFERTLYRTDHAPHPEQMAFLKLQLSTAFDVALLTDGLSVRLKCFLAIRLVDALKSVESAETGSSGDYCRVEHVKMESDPLAK